ncbi:MAG: hypothetical protein KGH82_05950, partial [Candidatus Micrarchaeota archaeon]|nr:hypothetical protein [Candidatus Micrarchaeota archaeon]
MRNQSSIEFLLTYAWAFLIIAIFLAFLIAVVTVNKPTALTPPSCYISPALPCISSAFISNSIGSKFLVVFINDIGQNIEFPKTNAIILSPFLAPQTYGGTCLPVNAPKEAIITCNVTMQIKAGSIGTQLSPKFTINYELCQGQCAAPVAPSNTINTTGFATLQVSPYVSNPINNLTLLTTPVAGQV